MKTEWSRGKIALSLLSWGIVTLLPTPSRADNPIVQTFYTADPAPMVHEGRLYLYTSHDEDNTVNNFYTMNDWRLYSTVDMVNWTDHGSPAGGKTFNWFTDNAWAVQAIPRNNKFYLYVPLNNNTGAKIGVGVADSPLGPFMDALRKPLAQQGKGDIDPTVFIDDDGQAYMYWGNGSLRYVKLNSDMTSYTGSITTVALDGFLEGPWFYKRESRYYMVYAANGSTEKLSYATSNSPTGPWTAKGDVMDAGKTYTNHPGVIDYKGHSYLFYHNSALPGGSDFKRSVCVEEFTYGADGSIPKVTMTTAGPKGIATLNPFQQVEAETIAFSAGLKTEKCSDTGGGMNVTSINNGDYIKVKDVDFLDGVTSFEARVSKSVSGAKIELHLDSQSGMLLGSCDVSGADAWTTKTCEVSGATGKHDLFLKFSGGSGELFKFNWWKFTGPSGDGTGGAGGGGGAGGAAGSANGGAAAGGTAAMGGGGVGGIAGGGGTLGGGNSGAGAGGAAAGNSGATSSGGSSVASGGALASGGAFASGGSLTTSGGAANAGGSSSASGGRVAGSGGSAVAGQGGVAGSDDGCSCHIGARQSPRSSAWLLASALLLLRRRRGERR